MRPQPHSSIEPQRFGLPKARIKRRIQGVESAIAEVDAETRLNTTLSGPCRSASCRNRVALRSSASSQLIRCQPASGSPYLLGRLATAGFGPVRDGRFRRPDSVWRCTRLDHDAVEEIIFHSRSL